MARGKTHVQTYLENDTADAFDDYKEKHDIDTNAEAGRRLLRTALENEDDGKTTWLRGHVLTVASHLALLALVAYIAGQTTAVLPPQEATMLAWVLFGMAGATVGVGVLLEELAENGAPARARRPLRAVNALVTVSGNADANESANDGVADGDD